MDLPDNLVSHRASWLKAMDRLIELEPISGRPDEDERGYWEHERRAMAAMYMDLDRLLAIPPAAEVAVLLAQLATARLRVEALEDQIEQIEQDGFDRKFQ
jgi:hypothetical protein